MPRGLVERRPPRGLLRLFLRAPLALYRMHMGWLLGGRFLRLEHAGRRSGIRHRTVLEVIGHDEPSGTLYVASGWGEGAHWLRNITKHPAVEVAWRAARFSATAERLPVDEAEQVYSRYAQRYPRAFRSLAGLLLGGQREGAPSAREVAAVVPVVALRPLSRSTSS
jgi:deazaflavin-dependent oxidoreductase (nitroreductase family)